MNQTVWVMNCDGMEAGKEGCEPPCLKIFSYRSSLV